MPQLNKDTVKEDLEEAVSKMIYGGKYTQEVLKEISNSCTK